MFVEGDAVHAESEPEQVDVLASVTDRVSAAEPHGVVEVAVDRFGVVAAGIQPSEVEIIGRNRADVLGAVQAALVVFGVAMEADGNYFTTDPIG